MATEPWGHCLEDLEEFCCTWFSAPLSWNAFSGTIQSQIVSRDNLWRLQFVPLIAFINPGIIEGSLQKRPSTPSRSMSSCYSWRNSRRPSVNLRLTAGEGVFGPACGIQEEGGPDNWGGCQGRVHECQHPGLTGNLPRNSDPCQPPHVGQLGRGSGDSHQGPQSLQGIMP